MAISVYQNSGGAHTNWEAFENQRCLFFNNIHVSDLISLPVMLKVLLAEQQEQALAASMVIQCHSRIQLFGSSNSVLLQRQNGDRCGTSNDFWNLYEADLERAAALNVKLFRLSIEWSRIQPRLGEVDLAAVQHYHQIFDAMDRSVMSALISLYHQQKLCNDRSQQIDEVRPSRAATLALRAVDTAVPC